ncbi:DUF1254 domain-containing protein [Metapseudomonas resinovorans]|uniref:DUF1254 domain-containing protein n=1 Tax=Metapseudomonas resinovorans NBRC 106553 TaxID=1245471 RepID=S6AFE6_METRE|nr:DUF1254 domain-containing protein [Pseudomonas resinovorans]BAN48672.1 hypothetical protein PCA10_29400 [Pseudomonas resinovorans NBRC 106553]
MGFRLSALALLCAANLANAAEQPHPIQPPPVELIRADRVEPGERPAQKVLYRARQLDAYSIGVQAYVYGWPAVENYRVCSRLLDPAFRHHAPLNSFRHETGPADDQYKLFVTPNGDLLYSQACLDLSQEPLVLHVPDTGDMRYWTAQVTDAYTETVANISKRSVGNRAGDYALVGPGWKGELPKGVTAVPVATHTGFILLRTFFEDRQDLEKRTRVVQRQFTLEPLSAYVSGKDWKAPELPADDRRRAVPADEQALSTSLEFFRILNRAMADAGPRPGEEALWAMFRRIGVGPGLPFDPEKLDSATREALQKAVADGWQLVQDRSATARTKVVNGWGVPQPDQPVGAFGYDYLQRAGLAHRGIYSNTADEYAAMAGIADTEARPLDGNQRYVLHFAKGDFPKVEAYWGLTIYRLPERLFYPNPASRWTLNSVDKGLQYNPDGSLDVLIQREAPAGREANWLPSPDGPFQLIVRAYRAEDPAIFVGDWAPPAIRRID